MSLSDEQHSFLLDACLLILFADRIGIKTTGGELERTEDQQRIHFASGRSMTMNSMHLKRLAIDLNCFKGGQYINALGREGETILRPLGVFWESLNDKNRWGGNFDKDFRRKDPWIDIGHFERQI